MTGGKFGKYFKDRVFQIIRYQQKASLKSGVVNDAFLTPDMGGYQSLVKTNRAAPILQLNLVILATLREYSNSFLY